MTNNNHSWVGTNIRKGDRFGVVIHDSNGIFRILTVEFIDSEIVEEIWLSNTGSDPEEVHKYEWFSKGTSGNKDKWYKF
jgi:hypothetical protein